MVSVFEFLDSDGTNVGCGTKVEFDYWTAEGVFVGYSLGKVIGSEPASCDEDRRKAWGI